MKGGKTVYNEVSKKATMKYMKEKRENLNINLPLGDKARYKEHAQKKGLSLTALIVELLEKDISENFKN